MLSAWRTPGPHRLDAVTKLAGHPATSFLIPGDVALTILCQGWRSHHVPSCISLVWSDRSITTCGAGPQIGEGHKSLTLALRFRAPERTLTEDEASAARGAAGAEPVGAVQRG